MGEMEAIAQRLEEMRHGHAIRTPGDAHHHLTVGGQKPLLLNPTMNALP